MSPSDLLVIPFEGWINAFVRGFLVPNFRPIFRAVQVPVNEVLQAFDGFFAWVPMLVVTLVFAFVAWRVVGRTMAIITIVGFVFIDMIQLWPETMTTLAMILTSVLFCTIIGIPAGILVAGSDMAWKVVRPILDIMQTVSKLRVLGADRHAVRRRHGARHHRDDHLRAAADHPHDQSRHSQRPRGPDRSVGGLWRHANADLDRGSVAACHAHDHGRPEPDADAGHVHGGHRRPDRGRWTGADRQHRPWPPQRRTGDGPAALASSSWRSCSTGSRKVWPSPDRAARRRCLARSSRCSAARTSMPRHRTRRSEDI